MRLFEKVQMIPNICEMKVHKTNRAMHQVTLISSTFILLTVFWRSISKQQVYAVKPANERSILPTTHLHTHTHAPKFVIDISFYDIFIEIIIARKANALGAVKVQWFFPFTTLVFFRCPLCLHWTYDINEVQAL